MYVCSLSVRRDRSYREGGGSGFNYSDNKAIIEMGSGLEHAIDGSYVLLPRLSLAFDTDQYFISFKYF